MNKQELLERYNRNYTEEEYFSKNVTFAFSNEQLQEAMKKLGAKNESELTSIFGMGDICLKSKVKDILQFVLSREEENKKWLKSLSREEQDIIIRHELYNYECNYSRDIEPVVDLFKNVFEYNDIMRVFHRIKKQ